MKRNHVPAGSELEQVLRITLIHRPAELEQVL